jgi:hypothetical protein
MMPGPPPVMSATPPSAPTRRPNSRATVYQGLRRDARVLPMTRIVRRTP